MNPKFILISILSFLSACVINVYARDNYDVFLLVGQSNMAGRGYMLEGDCETFDENVFILDDRGKVVPATNPLNRYSSIRKGMDMQRICPGYGFAKRISAKTGRKILLVVNARGGTTISQWAKGEGGEGYYEEAVRRTRQAMRHGELKAILWHQGCGDVRNTDTYMGKLSAFVRDLRSDLDADVPFIAGELGQWRPHVAGFNEMIHTIAEYIPESGWVSSDGCAPIVTGKSNGRPDLTDPHFDRASQILIGERYADKVLEMCYPRLSGNPLWDGEWYADPEVAVFEGRYWIFPTYSKPFKEQLFLDCFSSDDLVDWTRHERIITKANIPELNEALWAPSAIEKDGKYYLYFSINNIPYGGEPGGICVAVADSPEGPYGRAEIIISDIVNGAQPIDQFVFKDDDGSYYMYYGGWKHCNMMKMGDDMKSFVPFDDGDMVKEVTPKDYVEGPFMLKRNGRYYFMWSEGRWTKDDYRVAYAVADSPSGPFERVGIILESDPEVGTGAGHHSVFKGPGEDEWYIVYHRHPLGAVDGNHRVVCVDRMFFDEDGRIRPVRMTFEGVETLKK